MTTKNLVFHITLSIAVFCGCIIFTGCSGNQTPVETSSAKSKVVIGMGTEAKTLDPRISTDVASARIQQLVYNSLIKKNLQSELVPDLAESWEIINNTTYRFKLRKNIRFHDGSQFDARDVKATFDAILSDTLASPKKSAYDKLASITIIDDFTILFETTEPFAPFLINMVLGILPEAEARKHNPDENINPIGTGPFKVFQDDDDEHITLASFPEYFQGQPPLDIVEFKIVPDDAIRLMELEKGSVDFVENNVPSDSVPRLRENPDLKIMTAPGTSYYYMGFNFRLENHPTNQREVRHALAMALNRDEIIKHILGGLASKAVGVLPEGHWAFNKNLKQIPFDPEQATDILDKAGFPLKDGSRFSVEFKVSQNKQSRKLAEIIQAQWAKIGVKVNLQSLEWGTFYEDIINGNFETYVLSWVGVTDPDIYHSIFHSGSIPPNGRNRGHYINPDLDRLLDSARVELDPAARADLYRKVQRLIHDDLPYISMWHTHNVAIMKNDLMHFQLYPAGDLDSFAKVSWKKTP
ncbi:ABC transporter substrate-binding protein [bacterium]|nr:ABC transporter substrate-binding protein [bacterium]